ncbi:MAG: indolepyruvate oxidoreductase subunit beta [Spirochaetota bacterium]|jgi:indolepyruvate ferredoxin oxidoreductase beta subunit|uniref:indolepyruvate oxidoreductase subunit beta n=1 Tax=Gracilinema caldarium TaxID=215591 RepID=UPI0016B0E6FC|nr:indolepyruvate oxidoreductase subunit beta [Gracilinema caldarium]NLJ09184.1 indolepyruvate oxidoreductase subunit beta [Treponema sp.]
MKRDIILAGVGGQGILSVAAIIAKAAVDQGLKVRQSEVHGMSQRGGAVLAHLRLSDSTIYSDLVPKGEADLIISMEPLESLRYTAWLNPEGTLVSAAEPFINIPDYPELENIYSMIRSLPRSVIVETQNLAKEAGLARAANMVLIGAASPYLPIAPEAMEGTICELFATKEPAVIDANIKAFRLGRSAAKA